MHLDTPGFIICALRKVTLYITLQDSDCHCICFAIVHKNKLECLVAKHVLEDKGKRGHSMAWARLQVVRVELDILGL